MPHRNKVEFFPPRIHSSRYAILKILPGKQPFSTNCGDDLFNCCYSWLGKNFRMLKISKNISAAAADARLPTQSWPLGQQ